MQKRYVIGILWRMRAILNKIQQENSELRERVQMLETALSKVNAENQELRRINEHLKNKVFGRSSEQLDPRQIEFLLGLAPVEVAEPSKVVLFPVSTYRKVTRRRKL